MLKRIIKSRNGEGYVDMCVGVIVFVTPCLSCFS